MTAPSLALKKRFFPFALAANSQPSSIAAPNVGLRSLALVNANALPIEQQLADAFNANNAVMAYVLGITNATLPTIPSAPSWYSAFETAFSDAQIHANGWFPIATNLVSIPNSIAGYGIAFNSSMSTINSLLNVLRSNPTDAAAISALQAQLSGMISQISNYSQNAVTFNQTIQAFSKNLTNDASILAGAVQSSTQTQGVDQAQIQQFLQDIANLQSEIHTWQTVETAAAIAAGVAFFAGCVIAIFTFGIGLAFGIVAAAAGITVAIIASNKVKALQAQVIADQNSMNALTQQASALAALNTQLNTLIDLSQAAGAQVALVLQVWEELEAELNTVLTDLKNCEGDTTQLNLGQLQTDLNSANQDWQTLVGLCNTIASIKYNQANPPSSNLQS